MNQVMKFDVVLMNPPYSNRGTNQIHLRFVDKCLDIADKQVTVMPFTFVTKTGFKKNDKYKEKFSLELIEVEEINSSVFEGTSMPNVGVYVFSKDKLNSEIKITNKDGDETIVDTLTAISAFNGKEKEIVKYLESKGRQEMIGRLGHNPTTKQILRRQGITDKNEVQEKIDTALLKSISKIKHYFDDNKYALIVNVVNGGMNGQAISSKNGQIFDNFDDLKNFYFNRRVTNGYNVIIFDSKEAAENCKAALKRPLLRFTIYRTQEDQGMIIDKCYKYIPSIDWDKIKTDEDILIACGCDKDKAKEYVEYCKKVIDKVDKR